MQEGVQEIPAGTRKQDEDGTEAWTQHTKYGTYEKGTGNRIGHCMYEVCVEGERRHCAPEFTEKDPLCIRTASLEPSRCGIPRSGEEEECEKSSCDGET